MGARLGRLRREVLPTLERESSGASWNRLSVASQVLLVAVTAQAVFLLAVCGVVFSDHASKSADAYAIVWSLCAVSLVYFVAEGVSKEDPFSIWVPVATHLLATGYAALIELRGSGARSSMGPNYRFASLGVLIWLAVFQVAFFGLAWSAQQSFGYHAYRRVGGDPRLQHMYGDYTRFSSLLKLDFIVSAIVCTFAMLLYLSPLEASLDVVSLAASLFVFVFGMYSVREESRRAVAIFITFLAVLPAYIVVKLVEFYGNSGYWQLFSACVISLVTRACLLAATLKTMKNFGLGLRDQVFTAETAGLNRAESKLLDDLIESAGLHTDHRRPHRPSPLPIQPPPSARAVRSGSSSVASG